MNLIATSERFSVLYSVRNTALWFERPRKRRRGKTPLTIRLSHSVQTSAFVTRLASALIEDDPLPLCTRRYHQEGRHTPSVQCRHGATHRRVRSTRSVGSRAWV